jgi:hypothetical protein
MKIEFVKSSDNPNCYFIIENNKTIFKAFYNKADKVKSIYNLQNSLVAEGFSVYSKKLHFKSDYLIKLFGEQPAEVLIKGKSFFYCTQEFNFQGLDYVIIPHRGTFFSIFKTNKQIASYQTYDSVSGSNIMTLISDDDICKFLFCLLSLYLYSDFGSEGASPGASVNFWFQSRKFDKNWRPKNSS